MSDPLSGGGYSARVERLPASVKVLAFFGIAFSILAALIFGGSFLRSDSAVLVATEPPDPMPVETMVIQQQQSFASERKFTGVIRAKRTAQLSFAVAGQIDKINVVEGQDVRQGDVIAQVDMRVEKARLASSRAQIKSAEADYSLAKTELDRQLKLQDAGHISAQRVDNARARVDVAQTGLDAAKANAEAVKVAIGLGTLVAPFDGLINRRFIDEGAAVSPTAPVVELVETGVAEVVLGLPTEFISGLEVGQTYQFESTLGPVEAVFRNHAGLIDRSNRTIKSYFDVTPSETAILGDVVTLSLKDDTEMAGFIVPRQALTSAERGLWAVYATYTDEDGAKVERRPVEVLFTEVDRAYIRGPLADGEQIVTRGVGRLVDGQLIDPRPIDSVELE